MSEHDSPEVVQAWLTGVNLELGDRVPLRPMRENEIDAAAPAILSAARASLAGRATMKVMFLKWQSTSYLVKIWALLDLPSCGVFQYRSDLW